jgi:hypothetical protein
LTITVKNDDTTTVGQVDTALTAAGLPIDGFSHTTGGNAATLILLPVPATVILSGTFERELHTISAAELAAFFVAESLTEGDTLAIWYDELTEADPSTDGRRQSCDANINTVLIAGQLTNLTTHPERIPLAIPLCKRIGDDLLFIDGTVVAGALTNSPLDTTFGVHGYMLDLVFGGGLFNDVTYFAWLGVNATTFQEAWDNYIGVMDESVSTAAAGLLGFDDTTVLTPLWGGAAASIQDAIDDVMSLLDFPGAGVLPVCGASKIGFDGVTTPGALIPPFDVWTGLFSIDVWDALMNLGDALQDSGGDIWPGSPPGATLIGFDDTTFNLWGGGMVATVQAALDALATVLPAAAAPSGASLIGYDATTFSPWLGAATELQTALDTLVGAVARVAALDYITGEWWFYGDYDFNTSLQASTYPRGAVIENRLASPGEGWYDASYGNPADTGGVAPGVDSNYYEFDAMEKVIDTLVFWDTKTTPVAASRKMFVFLTSNKGGNPEATFRYGNALTGTLEDFYMVADVLTAPIAFCADNANNLYTYLNNGQICKYTWDGITFNADPGNPIYIVTTTALEGTAKILYSQVNNRLIIPTRGVAAPGLAPFDAQIHVIETDGTPDFDTDCGCTALGVYAGGLEHNGQHIWATFDVPALPGEIGASDFAGVPVPGFLTTVLASYSARELLYDGYRLWYHLHDPANVLDDLIGHSAIEIGGVWHDDAYTWGGPVGDGVVRFGFDGFNLWFYTTQASASGVAQVLLQRFPVAGATTAGVGAPVTLNFPFERWEVNRVAQAAPPWVFGRMFFDGFTLWLGPMYNGNWGVRIPWAVIR